jgi:hypothetical protein
MDPKVPRGLLSCMDAIVLRKYLERKEDRRTVVIVPNHWDNWDMGSNLENISPKHPKYIIYMRCIYKIFKKIYYIYILYNILIQTNHGESAHDI